MPALLAFLAYATIMWGYVHEARTVELVGYVVFGLAAGWAWVQWRRMVDNEASEFDDERAQFRPPR